MRLSLFSCFILSLFLLAGCDGNKQHFTVIGELGGMPEQRVLLQERTLDDKVVVVDSGRTKENGRFELSGEAMEPGLYQLVFEQGPYILLSIDKGNIRISGTWQNLLNFQQYEVQGSAPSASLRHFLRGISDHVRDIRTMDIVLDTLSARGQPDSVAAARKAQQGYEDRLTRYIEQYADTTAYLPNALFAAQILNRATDQPFIESFLTGLQRRFPNAPQAKEFAERYNRMLHQQQQQQQFTGGPVMGALAPEINLPTPAGTPLKLSSLRGKYVLVDFWASWCGPCRGENPNVVAAFNKFKDKGFTILGVSLDENKDNWTDAIQKDGLAWNHVSDLKRWESVAARDYGIEAIPTNFLLDKDGKIIARDLKGADLEAKLAEVLK